MKFGFVNKRKTNGSGAKTTASGLIFPTKGHEPRFDKLLPGAIKKLLDDGLVVENGRDSLGNLTYRITDKGKSVVASWENRT